MAFSQKNYMSKNDLKLHFLQEQVGKNSLNEKKMGKNLAHF